MSNEFQKNLRLVEALRKTGCVTYNDLRHMFGLPLTEEYWGNVIIGKEKPADRWVVLNQWQS